MRVVVDIEANGFKPTKVWLICCKDIDTGEYHVFRNPSQDSEERQKFIEFGRQVTTWIGHSLLEYDLPVLVRLLGLPEPDVSNCCDTLILSRLIDYPRDGHSIEDYGLEFGIPKGDFLDFTKYSKEMEVYCLRDVDICHRIYLKYLRYLSNPMHRPSIELEHSFQRVVNALHSNGFSFNSLKGTKLLLKVEEDLSILDKSILREFPAKLKLSREITPKATKFNTISLSSIPKELRAEVSTMSVGSPFSYCQWSSFNPSSHKQIVDVLSEAGWRPIDKTQTHIDTERELRQLKYSRNKSSELDLRLQGCHTKLKMLGRYGWKINENNLSTLPPSAPPAAKTLAKRIILESRRRTLTEWLALVDGDGRIHGKFIGIGAWTHRMAHQHPNTANIPNDLDTQGQKKFLGKEMRSLWCAPKGRLLVGVDAEGIQLRIFAHYIDDPEFTKALVEGKKHDKTDPHSLNQRILGSRCKSRAAAKRFIFALLLGAGIGKLSQILECSEADAQEALDRLIVRYTGFQELKESIIPTDARRGYFTGLDNRKVRILGETEGARKHLAMSGYLQNGEAVVMKSATVRFADKLKQYDALLVNLVHDEWQTECPNNMKIALDVAQLQCDSLREVGEELGLKCPMAGSFWNDDFKDYTIGTNWSVTH